MWLSGELNDELKAKWLGSGRKVMYIEGVRAKRTYRRISLLSPTLGYIPAARDSA